MAVLENEITFGIVLYKEELSHSVTFRSLLNSITAAGNTINSKVIILVFDNTPREQNKKNNETIAVNEWVEVHYYTINENKGLPFAYNLFGEKARELKKEWLVLLDQDTELPLDFFSLYRTVNPEIKIHCPLVFSNGSLMSPAYYKNFRSSPMQVPQTESIDLKNVSCINSGLMINVEFFQKIRGYNPDLFLDFCDHDFMYKAKKNDITRLGIIPCRLTQDFSSVSHTKEQALARYELFVKDLKTFYKDKDKIKIFFLVDLSRIISLTLKFKTLKIMKIRLKK
ncbi:MAG: hypothetical protein LBE92_10385 [Chryseobacterium sp.]|jgi:GT2 family glycosyltransferase|uniref:hypothetical protein n=1 Tax=Chryseobacterium sp. TaxID=1871047 RepID=UPI0028285346|nr:hypothetical protein [Chryseobacterium sp.]MDR2236523.1 hypothetical protein [Chryseobacterium sp.]